MTDHKFTIPFGGDPVNYAEDQRTPQDLQKFLSLPSARAILMHKGKAGIGDKGRLHRIHPSELIGHNLYEPGPIFLGLDGERPLFAASLQDPKDFLPEENFVDLRLGGGQLHPEDLAIAGRARSLFDWHRTHRYCANCGGGSTSDDGGAKRVCPHCETEHFPRVNPVVIMLITYQDRVLLGRGPGWPDGAMSTLAGFVSPGETVEEAARREILEEVGIETSNFQYIFSQPWPFPSQLMIGLSGEAHSDELSINTDELEDAKWYSRDEVTAVMNKTGDAFLRPPRVAIAHQLLKRWVST